jgi:hypothetical protein
VTELLVCGLSLKVILDTLDLGLPAPGRIARTVLAAIALGLALAGLRAAGAPLGALAVAACLLYPALLFGLHAIEPADVAAVLRRGAA